MFFKKSLGNSTTRLLREFRQRRRTRRRTNRHTTAIPTEVLEQRQLLTLVAPEILLPSQSGTTFDRTPLLQWDQAGDSESYEVWVSQLGANQGAVYRESGLRESLVTVPSTLNLQDHRFWVRGFDSDGTAGPWSQPVDFEITADRPSIHSPAVLPSGQDVDLRWDTLSGAKTYEIWLSDVTSGVGTGTILIQADISTNSHSVLDLPRGRDYRYWVRGVSGDGTESEWSFANNFHLAQPDLGQPQIVSPARFSSTAESRPILRWTEDPTAATYEVSVYELAAFGNGTEVFNETGIVGTEFQLPSDLDNYRHRVWVRSVDANGNVASWGAGHEFTAVTNPSISSVAYNSSQQTQSVVISSPYSADSFSVNVHVYEHASDALVFSAVGVGATQLTLPSLQDGQQYRAELQGVGSDGTTSAWGDSHLFTGVSGPLLVNGDFSLNSVSTPWDVFYYSSGDTVSYSGEQVFHGWQSDKPIELHSDGFIELDSDLAGHPSRFGEPNLHPARTATPNGGANASVWQDVTLAPNTLYHLSFEHSGTANSLSTDNSLAVNVTGDLQASDGGIHRFFSTVSPGSLVSHSTSFRTGGSGSDPVTVRILFKDTGTPNNDLGNRVGSVHLSKADSQDLTVDASVSISSDTVTSTTGIDGHRVVIGDLRQPVQLKLDNTFLGELARGRVQLEYSSGTVQLYDSQVDPENLGNSGTAIPSSQDLSDSTPLTLQQLLDGVTVYAEGLAVGASDIRLKVLSGDGLIAEEAAATVVVTGADPLIIYVEFRDNSLPVPVKLPAGHPLALTDAQWETILVTNRDLNEQSLGDPVGLPDIPAGVPGIPAGHQRLAALGQKITRAEVLLNTLRTRIATIEQMIANPQGHSNQSFFNQVDTAVYEFDTYFHGLTEASLAFGDYFALYGSPPNELETRLFGLPAHVDGLDVQFKKYQLDAAAAGISAVTDGVNAQLEHLDNAETGIYVGAALGAGIAFAPAAIWLAGTAPGIFAGKVLAEVAPWLLLNAGYEAASSRIEDGQTSDQVIVGTVSDLTGVTSLKLGVEQVDPVTGQKVQLTPGQRATHIVGGSVQLALTITGLTAAGRSFGEELRLFSNRLGGGGGGGLQPQLVTSTAGLRVSGPPTATLGATGTGTGGGVLVGTLGGLRPVVVYMTRGGGQAPDYRVSTDDIAENLSPDEYEDHGDPENWTFVRDKPGFPIPSTNDNAEAGAEKVIEWWKDASKRILEVHYIRRLDGTFIDIKIKPFSP